jgi:hypothetical protein
LKNSGTGWGLKSHCILVGFSGKELGCRLHNSGWSIGPPEVGRGIILLTKITLFSDRVYGKAFSRDLNLVA